VGSINDVMEAFRRAPTNYDRGALFERLMLRYFQLDPAGGTAPPRAVIPAP
jgi:predicted helicase